MTVGSLDRRTLAVLLGGLLVIVILRFGVYGERPVQVVAPADSVPLAEKRLERLRQVAATVPGKEVALQQAAAERAARERGLLQADTGPQAQALLLNVISRVAAANGVDVRGAAEMREPKPLGGDYGEVSVAVAFTCGIEQLVNLLAALTNEPEILATNQIQISGGNDKKKNIQVRLSLSGVVPKKLVPVKKGAVAF